MGSEVDELYNEMVKKVTKKDGESEHGCAQKCISSLSENNIDWKYLAQALNGFINQSRIDKDDRPEMPETLDDDSCKDFVKECIIVMGKNEIIIMPSVELASATYMNALIRGKINQAICAVQTVLAEMEVKVGYAEFESVWSSKKQVSNLDLESSRGHLMHVITCAIEDYNIKVEAHNNLVKTHNDAIDAFGLLSGVKKANDGFWNKLDSESTLVPLASFEVLSKVKKAESASPSKPVVSKPKIQVVEIDDGTSPKDTKGVRFANVTSTEYISKRRNEEGSKRQNDEVPGAKRQRSTEGAGGGDGAKYLSILVNKLGSALTHKDSEEDFIQAVANSIIDCVGTKGQMRGNAKNMLEFTRFHIFAFLVLITLESMDYNAGSVMGGISIKVNESAMEDELKKAWCDALEYVQLPTDNHSNFIKFLKSKLHGKVDQSTMKNLASLIPSNNGKNFGYEEIA